MNRVFGLNNTLTDFERERRRMNLRPNEIIYLHDIQQVIGARDFTLYLMPYYKGSDLHRDRDNWFILLNRCGRIFFLDREIPQEEWFTL